jgi:hypothetical protein
MPTTMAELIQVRPLRPATAMRPAFEGATVNILMVGLGCAGDWSRILEVR